MITDLLKTEDAAEYLGISVTRLKQIVASPKHTLRPVLRGKPNWYDLKDLAAFKKLDRPHGNPNLLAIGKLKPDKPLRKSRKK